MGDKLKFSETDAIDMYKSINTHALHMIQFFKSFADLAGNDSWSHRQEKQDFRDALESMKRSGLILDYDLAEFTITTMTNRILAWNYSITNQYKN